MAILSPGLGWAEGRILTKHWGINRTGKHFYNNGFDVVLSKESPGTDWVEGKLLHMYHTYTDADKQAAKDRAINQTKNGKNALVGGTIQKETNKLRLENGTHQTQTMHACPHCGKIGKGPGMFRHHFDRCKSKPLVCD